MQQRNLYVDFYARLLRVCMLILVTVLIQTSLFGETLTYQQYTGKLKGFSINSFQRISRFDNQSLAAHNHDSGKGFVGRILYEGEPGATLKVDKFEPAPSPTGGSYDQSMLYWTQLPASTEGNWTELFIVLRAKGYTHNTEKQPNDRVVDYFGKNTVFEKVGQGYELQRGAGPSEEKATAGQIGYDKDGNSGTYDGSNQFEYKYQYRVIFIDVTIFPKRIGTPGIGERKYWTGGTVIESIRPQNGYYESKIIFYTDTATLPLMLEGEYNPNGDPPLSPSCIFNLTKLATSVSYQALTTEHTSQGSALEVAKLTYASPTCKAAIAIVSDPVGRSTDFAFTTTINGKKIRIPHKLVYRSDTGRQDQVGTETVIDDQHKIFYTFEDPYGPPAPIGDTLGKGHYLEGRIGLFIDPVPSNPPLAGTYSSTIYVLVERYQ